jgi:hypothetical protein
VSPAHAYKVASGRTTANAEERSGAGAAKAGRAGEKSIAATTDSRAAAKTTYSHAMTSATACTDTPYSSTATSAYSADAATSAPAPNTDASTDSPNTAANTADAGTRANTGDACDAGANGNAATANAQSNAHATNTYAACPDRYCRHQSRERDSRQKANSTRGHMHDASPFLILVCLRHFNPDNLNRVLGKALRLIHKLVRVLNELFRRFRLENCRVEVWAA